MRPGGSVAQRQYSHCKQNVLDSSPDRASIVHLLHKVSQNGDCLTVIYTGVLGGHARHIENIIYSIIAWHSGLCV